jgi:hypothetical protein
VFGMCVICVGEILVIQREDETEGGELHPI